MPLKPQSFPALTLIVLLPLFIITSTLLLPCPASIVPFVTVQLYVGTGDAATTLKLTEPPEHHKTGFAVIVPGVEGAPVSVTDRVPLFPGVQRFVLATTLNVPLVKVFDTCSRMVVVPCPEFIVVPAGFVQL